MCIDSQIYVKHCMCLLSLPPVGTIKSENSMDSSDHYYTYNEVNDQTSPDSQANIILKTASKSYHATSKPVKK